MSGKFTKITEQPSLYDELEVMPTKELLESINREDCKVAEAVGKCIPEIGRLADGITERIQHGGRLFYIGAGTSGRLGVLDASEVPPTFGMPQGVVTGIIAGGDAALRNSIEGAEDDPEQGWQELQAYNINPLDTVIGIAASGTTPYAVETVKQARKNGCLTGAITSNPGSPLAEEAEISVVTIVGPEFVTGSSRMKSGTAQKMALNMISTSVMIKLGRVKGNRMVDMQLKNQKLVDRGARIIMEELRLEYEQAKTLLLLHGSVRKAVEEHKKQP